MLEWKWWNDNNGQGRQRYRVEMVETKKKGREIDAGMEMVERQRQHAGWKVRREKEKGRERKHLTFNLECLALFDFEN